MTSFSQHRVRCGLRPWPPGDRLQERGTYRLGRRDWMAAEMINRARSQTRRRAPTTFQVAFAQDLPFADDTFDAVACTLALHHG